MGAMRGTLDTGQGCWRGKGQQMVIGQQALGPETVGLGRVAKRDQGGKNGGRSLWLGSISPSSRGMGQAELPFKWALMTSASPEHQASSFVSHRN